MKKIYLFLATAALFAACSSDDLAVKEQPQGQGEEGVVAFDVYTQKATRAGWAGPLTTEKLKESAVDKAQGFGVFGYYTDNNDYEQRATPNFFYNQKVYWDSEWKYEPVKYWPNEYGDKATSDDADKVTYFAYAPWVDIIPTSGKIAKLTGETDEQYKAREQWGITGMTKNTSQGDPLVKYIASFNTNKSVDLCWGVADNNDGVWPIVLNDAALNIANGTPWLNVQRPASVGQKVKFTFKHATAQMRINIDAIVDAVRGGVALDAKTRIWVRQVTFKGFALKGTLNLNNDDNANKPYWLDYNGQNELVAEDVIVYDGRKDGKEGVNGAIATNEKTLGLNPALVQDGAYEGNAWAIGNASTVGNTVYNATAIKVQGVVGTGGTEANCVRTGVTTTTVNLFNNAAVADEVKNENDAVTGGNSIFHVIPVDENFEVEIVYDVETVSENLAQNLSDGATKGTSIENRIRKTITFGDNATTGKKLQPGHSYTLNLHLGMNSVEFDATVTDWIEEATQDVDLPLNAPVFEAAAQSGSAYPQASTTIPYDATKYTFAISGLNGGESVKFTEGANKVNTASNVATTTASTLLTSWAKTKAEANAGTNGIAIETLTTALNPTTSNRTQVINWKGNQSSKGIDITFTQLAHPLGLHVGSNNTVTYAASTKTITLERSAEITSGFGWMCAGLADNCIAIAADAVDKKGEYITVKRNGVTLKWATATTDADTFTFSDGAGTITLKDDIQVGDVYEVTLKTGDAPAETISIKVI